MHLHMPAERRDPDRKPFQQFNTRAPGPRKVEADATYAGPVQMLQFLVRCAFADYRDTSRVGAELPERVDQAAIVDPIARGLHHHVAL